MKAIVNAKLKTMAPKKRGVKVKEEYESGVILIDGDKLKNGIVSLPSGMTKNTCCRYRGGLQDLRVG